MNLNTDSSLRDTKVWYFEWAAAGRERMQNITARVAAVTGELIGFYIYTPRPALTGSTGQQATLSKKDAQALAEEFLIKIQPDKFKQSKLKADPANEPVPVAAAVSKAVSAPLPIRLPIRLPSLPLKKLRPPLTMNASSTASFFHPTASTSRLI
jgi:hypothetical protein